MSSVPQSSPTAISEPDRHKGEQIDTSKKKLKWVGSNQHS